MKIWAVLPGRKKVARNNKVTVLPTWPWGGVLTRVSCTISSKWPMISNVFSENASAYTMAAYESVIKLSNCKFLPRRFSYGLSWSWLKGWKCLTLASKHVGVGLEKWKATWNSFIAKVLNKIEALLHQLSNLCLIYLTWAVLAKSRITNKQLSFIVNY